MPSADLLAHHLRRHAGLAPERMAFAFLADGEEVASELSYGGLLREAEDVAGALRRAGLAGRAAVLFHPPGRDFIVAFCGCLMAGAIAVPLQPPVTRRLLDRADAVLRDCAAAAVLTVSGATAGVQQIAAERGLPIILTDRVEPGAGDPGAADPDPDAPAVLQYTSGSTGQPKGVVITQRNLVANSRQIAAAFGMRPGDTVLNWLPLLHDMGLIGHVVHIIQQGVRCVHMTPQAMIRKPLRWLQAVSRFRAEVSGGPDFAWRLIAERVAPADLAGLDLSCWRVAFSGAEMVRMTTLERVAAILGPAGFSGAAFLPCYGMAEATLIISGGPGGRPPRAARPATAAADPVPAMNCGGIVAGCAVAIVDPESGIPLPEGREGEIWASGANVAAGYWGRPELTQATFRNRLPGDDRDWLRTGDLGFLVGGDLHISGRIKDLLIVHGRKHHPEDLECTVQAMVADCASGAAAAFQTDDEQPQVVIAVEVEDRPASREEHLRLVEEVRAAVWAQHEVVVDAVLVVRVGRIPRTTSGKVRRAETRSLWLAHALGAEGPA